MADRVEPSDLLLLEPRKVVTHLQTREDGSRVLRVSYGNKVVEFEGDTLDIGQRIFDGARHELRAREAAGSADGRQCPWHEVSEVLEALVSETILRREGTPESVEPSVVPALNTDSAAPVPLVPWRSLGELCKYASARLGHAIRVDAVETGLGVRPITQMVRDDEGRQGGENGLAMLAPALADPVPTEWRRCKYRGSRFDDPRPMNLSALRQLQRHFAEVVGVIAAVRARYQERSGLSELGLGHLSILAEVLNALPAWLLVRPRAPIASGEQPAWAHSVAKTVAGIDMSIRFLADESDEHTLDSPVTAADLHRAAEFSGLFGSATGVCSGSAPMIDRACRAFTGEDAAPGGEDALAACGSVDELLDYGLAWCRLTSARTLGECQALMIVEDELARDVPAADSGDRSALLQAVALERQILDRIEGSLERRVDLLEYRYRGVDRLVSSRAPDVRAMLSEAAGDVVATEERTLTLVSTLQEQLNATIGRPSVGPIERADLMAERSLRGLGAWSEHLPFGRSR